MAAQKKLRAVLFIDKTYCQIGFENNANILTFQYPPTVIQDLEIISLEEFHKHFQAFLTQSKIPPADFFMVLGNNLFFIKDIKTTPKAPPQPGAKDEPKTSDVQAPEEAEIQKFLSNVPFENVSFKVFKKDQLVRILATNRDLFEAFKKSIEKQGGTIAVIIPGFAFELYKGIKLGASLTAESARIVFKNIDSIKDQSLLVNQEVMTTDDDAPKILVEEKSPIHDPKKRMLAYGGIFSVLILILGYLVVTQIIMGGNKLPTKPVEQSTPEPAEVAQVSSPTPTVASLSAEMKAAVTIQILSQSKARTQAADLSSLFKDDGFTNVHTGTSSTQVQTAQVVYKPGVNSLAKDQITALLETAYPNNSVIENTDAEFDVTITIPASNSASISGQ